jgi:hypothetical protein
MLITFVFGLGTHLAKLSAAEPKQRP